MAKPKHLSVRGVNPLKAKKWSKLYTERQSYGLTDRPHWGRGPGDYCLYCGIPLETEEEKEGKFCEDHYAKRGGEKIKKGGENG